MRCGTVSLPRGGIADHRGRYEGRVLQADHVPPCGWLRPHGRPRRGSRQALPLTRAEEYRCKAEEAERTQIRHVTPNARSPSTGVRWLLTPSDTAVGRLRWPSVAGLLASAFH